MTSGYDGWKLATPPQYEDGTPAPSRQVPRQRPGRSRQDYGTPRDFIEAVERRFGPLAVDLAATGENAKAPLFVTPEQNSLYTPWAENWPTGNLWLNPPYDRIAPWAEKCVVESTRRHGLILMLVPASIGAQWFHHFVDQEAHVLALSPRLVFEGETKPYPKDLILCVYGYGLWGFSHWRWR